MHLNQSVSKISRTSRLVNGLKRLRYRLSSTTYHDLVIFDDFYPQPLSTFRFLEFNSYLKRFPSSAVYSSGGALPIVADTRDISEVITEFETNRPEFSNRVHKYDPSKVLKAHVGYNIFAMNSYSFHEIIGRSCDITAFTLYPGGGFQLDVEESDFRLRHVMGAASFRKVIVTQKVSKEYLLRKQFCHPDQIEFIYGGVLPRHPYQESAKHHFQITKPLFDVCFVAQKYSERGRDKGYDVFIGVAKCLARLCPSTRFHVVGPFGPDDVDISGLEDLITFHGTIASEFLGDFYRDMDIIVSPNAPFLLGPGYFDGFPTGAVAEAGMCGVVVLATDILNQNISFQDGRDIFLIDRNVDSIVSKIEFLYQNPDKLRELSIQAHATFSRVFDAGKQMSQRFDILEALLRS